jgi:hypothetical protein
MMGPTDMITRRNSQPLLESCMEFLGAPMEKDLKGKWPDSQDELGIFSLFYMRIVENISRPDRKKIPHVNRNLNSLHHPDQNHIHM